MPERLFRGAFLAALAVAALAAGARAGDDDEDGYGDNVDSSRAIINVPEAAPPDEEPGPPLWMELYGEAAKSRHEDGNVSGFSDIKAGKRFKLPLPFAAVLDIYGKARLNRDQADFYWNNQAMAGGGLRFTLLKPVSLTFFADAMTGSYLRTGSSAQSMQGLQNHLFQTNAALDAAAGKYVDLFNNMSNRSPEFDTTLTRQDIIRRWDSVAILLHRTNDSAFGPIVRSLDSLQTEKDNLYQAMDSAALIPSGQVTQFQAGLVFWYGWGQPKSDAGSPWFSFPFRFWGEVYSDLIFQDISRHVMTRSGGDTYADSLVRLDNLIYYMNPDAGILLMDGRAGSAALYATAYVWYDSHSDWWNNLAMAGPGLRWQPFAPVDFVITAEYLWGRYYGRENAEDPNPYDRSFQDLRIGANFWYGLGF
jgi:hypothetical protein